MAELLANKVAVVTGAASGNGRGIALAFARHGAKAVIVADLRQEPREGGQPTHELIEKETQTRAKFVPCDVTKVADLEAIVEAAEEFGGVDIMAPLHRFGKPADIGDTAVYLASDLASYVSGASLVVDGGRTRV